MPMKVVLFTQPECPVCDEAVEVMKPYIQKGEVEVMDVTEGLKHYDLGEPEGVPFMAVISPSRDRRFSEKTTPASVEMAKESFTQRGIWTIR